MKAKKKPPKRNVDSSQDFFEDIVPGAEEEGFLEFKLIPYLKGLVAELEYQLSELKGGDKKRR